jgi:hypothetical protein
MKPIHQTRIGDDGNCFAACLSSILETPIPEFGSEPDFWPNVDRWLARRGLRYTQTSDPPLGWHTIEGISPRGGPHAVVGRDGKFVFDPHPHDGTGRGLVRVDKYGVLTPL